MKNVYESVNFLDKRVVDEFGLSEEILMENAAMALEKEIDRFASKNSMIIIVAGSGNNGADGLVLARRISKRFNVKIFMPSNPHSVLCELAYMRAQTLECEFIDKLYKCDIIVDCLFGSGFRGNLEIRYQNLIEQMNTISRKRIACDIPSGITKDGSIDKIAFKADVTVSMGALKLAYFSDKAKDFIGEIIEANLGISSANYEVDSDIKLLESSDLRAPHRILQNTHKGDFGHCCVIAGEKQGACVLSALSAFAFGAGLVSIIGKVDNIPYHIMNTMSLPDKCNAIAFGMGLGNEVEKYDFDFIGRIPSVIDADMFYHRDLPTMLEQGNIILTPHMKEFRALLSITGIGDFDIDYIIANKIKLAQEFSIRFDNVVLLLKGANTIIANKGRIYINNLGSNNLAKGGSGDVLSGMIVSLLAQKYSLLDSAISASLAHSIAARNIESSYGLEPLKLIEEIKKLEKV